MTSTLYRMVRNSTTLSAGQIVSRVLVVAYGILLGRYLGASGYGNIGVAVAVTTMAYVLIDFGLAPLMVRDVARDHGVVSRYASNVIAVKLTLMVLVNAGLAVFLALSDYSTELQIIVWLYSLNAALVSMVSVGAAGLQGMEEMHIPAILQVGRDVLNVSVSVLAVALHASIVTLVWISVAASAVQLLFMVVVAARNGVRASLKLVQLRFARGLFVASIPFAAFMLLSALYFQIGVVMVSLWMPLRETGLYAVAVSMAGFVGLLSAVFAQAVFPVFSRYHVESPDKLKESYRRMFRYMVILGFGVTTVAALPAKEALDLILGEEYVAAWTTAVILILNQALAANSINGSLMNSTGRQKLFTATYVIAVVLQVLVSWRLIPRYGAEGAALGFIVPSLLGYILYTVLCHRFVKLPLPWLLHGRCLLAATVTALVVVGFARLGLGMLLSAILFGPVVYVLMVLVLRTLSRQDMDLAGQALAPIRARLLRLRANDE